MTVDPDGTSTLWLGLSAENRKRLPVEPILIDAPSVDLTGGKLVILGGETEHSMAEQLAALGLPIPDAALVEPTPPPGSGGE